MLNSDYDLDVKVPRWFIALCHFICLIFFISLMGHFIEDDNRQALRDACYLSNPMGISTDPQWIDNCVTNKLKEQTYGPSR